MYSLRFDGLFRELAGEAKSTQAGLMCYGWVIFKHDRLIAQGHGVFARGRGASSNGAEYLALIEGLDALIDLGVRGEHVKVFGDAKSVIDQMRGSAGVNSPGILPLFTQAKRLAVRLPNLRYIWTPRRQNKAADWLTRKAMKQMRFDPQNYQEMLQTHLTADGKLRRSDKLLPLIDLRIYQPGLTQAVPPDKLAVL